MPRHGRSRADRPRNCQDFGSPCWLRRPWWNMMKSYHRNNNNDSHNQDHPSTTATSVQKNDRYVKLDLPMVQLRIWGWISNFLEKKMNNLRCLANYVNQLILTLGQNITWMKNFPRQQLHRTTRSSSVFAKALPVQQLCRGWVPW